MKFAVAPGLLAATLLALSTGCGGDPNIWDENTAKGAAESEPFLLGSEQVSMNAAQLACGVSNDLWETPTAGAERSISRLQQKGHELNFSDDITSEDRGFSSPYTQVRGKFPLQLDHVVSTKDGEDSDTKIVQAKVGVRISHPCFEGPLNIIGVRKGKYSEDLPVTLQYEHFAGSWHLTKVLH